MNETIDRPPLESKVDEILAEEQRLMPEKEALLQEMLLRNMDLFNQEHKTGLLKRDYDKLLLYIGNMGTPPEEATKPGPNNTFLKAFKYFWLRSGLPSQHEDIWLIGSHELKEELRKIFHFED